MLPEPSTAGCSGSAVTVPITPKCGSRITRTDVPISSTPAVAPPALMAGPLPCPAAAASASGTTISGRMTPARICVAPLTLATRPACPLSSAKVRSAMAISPKPSVMMSVIPMRSLPVTATPMSCPRKSRRSWSSMPPETIAAAPTSFAFLMAAAVMRAPPTTTAPFMSGVMSSASSSSLAALHAMAIGPCASPPTPKMPCTSATVFSITAPSPGSTSTTVPATYAATAIGCFGPRTITMPVESLTLSMAPSAELFTSVFIMPKMPLERAIGSSLRTASPSCLSISPGRSFGCAASMFATFMGNASPSMKVCATTVSARTVSPCFTVTLPSMGSTRRAR